MPERPIASPSATASSPERRRPPQLDQIEERIRSLDRRAASGDPSAIPRRQSLDSDDPRLEHSAVAGESATSRDLYLLCREEGELVGGCYLATSRGGGEVGTLSLVGVEPRLRRQGLASTLCARARDAFLAQGGRVIFLGLGNGNAPALRLYHRLGWRKLAGSNIMALVGGEPSPESFLVDYFRPGSPASVAAGAIAADGIPMLPLLYSPHDWQVLDANAGILSTRYATQTSCMALFWRYETLRRDGPGDWFVAKDDRGRIVGLSSVVVASDDCARIDAFAHPGSVAALSDLAARAIAWAADRGLAQCEVTASVEDEDRQRFFQELGFLPGGAGGAGFRLDARFVPAIRLRKQLAARRARRAAAPDAPAATDGARRREPILPATFEHLRRRYPEHIGARRIRSVHLDNYFTAVELDDGSVGACMSYYRFPLRVLELVQRKVDESVAADPLLTGWLFGPSTRATGVQEALLVASLQATVVSALSDRFLRAGGDETFVVHAARPFDPFADAERALVLGFGGYMARLAELGNIRELHVSDLSYGRRRGEMDARLDEFRRRYPEKTITISDGHDTERRLARADVVSITGSALCNGSLDELLEAIGGGPRVVVQGASACIHPQALFQRGVAFVATMLKPRDLARLAALDPERNGRWTRPVLERQLPWTYLTPAPHGPSARR